ncbi:MAG: phosphoribosylglycinamide formyltransferase [Candidatus Woesearchaeota archaeon]
MSYTKVAMFGSGKGSNIEAILDKADEGKLEGIIPSVIISNNKSSDVLRIAESRDIPGYWIPGKDNEEIILGALEKHDVNLIILAGYMKKLEEDIISQYTALNIHPSLLPKYGGKGMYGMKVHEAVIEAGEKESGATVHIADNEYDRGRILAQYKVPVFEKDTPETLSERVKEVEHILYPQTLRDIQHGIIDI